MNSAGNTHSLLKWILPSHWRRTLGRGTENDDGDGTVDDEGRVLPVAVIDDERELAEAVRVAAVAEVFGNEVCEIGE